MMPKVVKKTLGAEMQLGLLGFRLNGFSGKLPVSSGGRFGCRQMMVFGPPSEANSKLARHILVEDNNSLLNQSRQNAHGMMDRGSLVGSLDNLIDIVFKDREGHHDGYGIGLITSDGKVSVHKNAQSAAENADTFKAQVDELLGTVRHSKAKTVAMMGHLRWATSGSLTADNNHPLKAKDHHQASNWLMIHNGTMKQLVTPQMDSRLKAHPELQPKGDSDSARFLAHFMVALKEKYPNKSADDLPLSELMDTFEGLIRKAEDHPQVLTHEHVNAITSINPFKLTGVASSSPGNTVVLTNGKVVLAHRGVRTLFIGANINNKTHQVDGYVLASEPPKQVAPPHNPNHHVIWAPIAQRHLMALYLNKKGELESTMRPLTFSASAQPAPAVKVGNVLQAKQVG
jgi:predicted glutamine amidotransferase